jgi:hypothetical protein
MTNDEIDALIRKGEIRRQAHDAPLNRASKAAVAAALAEYREQQLKDQRVAAWLKTGAGAAYRKSRDSDAIKGGRR